MGVRNPIGLDGMSMEEFDNEIIGNNVCWRIVFNEFDASEGRAALFVYRRVDRGDGHIITEYLHKDGRVYFTSGSEGRMINYGEVGLAFACHNALLAAPGGAFDPDHAAYLERYRPGKDVW